MPQRFPPSSQRAAVAAAVTAAPTGTVSVTKANMDDRRWPHRRHAKHSSLLQTPHYAVQQAKGRGYVLVRQRRNAGISPPCPAAAGSASQARGESSSDWALGATKACFRTASSLFCFASWDPRQCAVGRPPHALRRKRNVRRPVPATRRRDAVTSSLDTRSLDHWIRVLRCTDRPCRGTTSPGHREVLRERTPRAAVAVPSCPPRRTS